MFENDIKLNYDIVFDWIPAVADVRRTDISMSSSLILHYVLPANIRLNKFQSSVLQPNSALENRCLICDTSALTVQYTGKYQFEPEAHFSSNYLKILSTSLGQFAMITVSHGPRQANLCLRAFRHDKF